MKIVLTEEDHLGQGTNKICYYHPEDKDKIIKFSLDRFHENDLEYELKYRRACKEVVARSTLLTKYYGTVETDKGIGHIFELVRDYDGKISETFESLILREKNSPKVFDVLAMLKKTMLKESIVTYKIFPDNFLVQRLSEQEYCVRIIDGIGMHVLFPLPYYSNFLARYRQKSVFTNFIKLLRQKYGFQGEI